MDLLPTGIFYLLIGAAVGLASCLRDSTETALARAGRGVLTAVFWPLYLPLLLGGTRKDALPGSTTAVGPPGPRPTDRNDPRVQRAQECLQRGLQELDQVTAGVLLPEKPRLAELGASLHRLSERRAEMDRLLASPEFDASKASALLTELSRRSLGEDDPRVSSLRTRVRNIARLTALRDHTAELLERTLLKLEELSSQVLLLRFTENPEREVADLMRDLAASVEGLTEGLAATA